MKCVCNRDVGKFNSSFYVKMESLSKFDNDVTAMYKMAASLGIPVKYAYTAPDGTLKPVYALINNQAAEGRTLMDIYTELDVLAPNLSAVDIAMLYAHMQLVAEVPIGDI